MKTDLAELIENIEGIAVLMLDPEGVVTTWCQGAQDIKGYSPDEIIGKHFSVFFTREDKEKGTPEMLLEKAAENGYVQDCSWRVRKDQSTFWGDVYITCLKGTGGTVLGFIKIVRDLTTQKELDNNLRQSEKRFRLMVEAMPNAIILVNSKGNISLLNSQAEVIFGYNRDELIGKNIEVLVPMDSRSDHKSRRTSYASEPSTRSMGSGREIFGLHKNGSTIPVEIGLNPINTPEGPHVLASIIDITERKAAEARLKLYARAFENTSDGIVITDAESNIIEVNNAYCEITGFGRSDLLGKTPKIISSGKHDRKYYDEMWKAVKGKGRWIGEIWDRKKNGELFPQWLSINAVCDNKGNLKNYIGIFSDISSLKQAQSELSRMAFYDSLTSLPNRTLFRERVDQEIANCKRTRDGFAVLFLDVDRFKHVNDSLGHVAGDRLLVEVSARLAESIRVNDTVARWGGDEFTIILKDIDNPLSVINVANKILNNFSRSVNINEMDVHIGASIGIALYPEDGESFDALTKNADLAMYQAKEAGRGTYKFFTETMNKRLNERLLLERKLYYALDNNEFSIYYQPQVELKTGKIIGAEALIRWNHPELGMISPTDFIPIAEENGLIIYIGEWVFNEVCCDIRKWRNEGLPDIKVSINLSPRQFRHNPLVKNITEIISKNSVPPSLIEVEITEGIVFDLTDASLKILNDFHDLGLSIAIDDFGTGYSSLSYIKQLPVNRLKIDRSFVSDIPGDLNDAAITIAIIQMAKSLGLDVVAEGVETREQLEFLKEHNCDFYQGKYFSMPVEQTELESMLAISACSSRDTAGQKRK